MKYKNTLLIVKDLNVSKHFYKHVLGLRVFLDFHGSVTLSAGIVLQSYEIWKDIIRKNSDEIVTQNHAYELCFDTEDIDDFMNILKESINVQVAIMENAGMSLKEGFNTSDIVNYINNMLPAILFLQGMIVTFIIYALETFVLRRIRLVNLRLPKFIDFYLPGNAVTASFTIYILVLFMDLIKVNLYTDLIMLNLQLVFNFMFMLQGISVSIYYLKKWIRGGSLKMIFMSLLILSVFGFMGISFVGMLDSIIDFRRVRSYKST